MTKKLSEFIIEVYHVIGSRVVKAKSAQEAMETLKSSNYKIDGLMKLFNHGYSGNLQVRALRINRKDKENAWVRPEWIEEGGS